MRLGILIGLAVLALGFEIANPNFLTPRNLTNLILQIAAMGTISIGLTLVLLLGEIDLSAGAVSGLGAAITAVLNVRFGVSAPLALLAGVACGAAIGAFQGAWVTRLGVPSFVVTLAGLLAWQGVLLAVLGPTGSLNLDDPLLLGLMNQFIPFPFDRGLPVALLVLLALLAGFDFLVRRTRFGRHLLAIGGNADAARRAGIHVQRIRIAVFALCSALAAFGGILAASLLRAVNQSSGSGDVLLNAIAAAVIGGTSLFGGRGSVWSALLGALVIGAVSNGMDLLGFASPVKLMVTGAVLLLSVTVDAAARRQTAR
ncbi:MAG: sugar ABC transporter permease [Myxococcaceae bacterium]